MTDQRQEPDSASPLPAEPTPSLKPWVAPTIERVELMSRTNKTFSSVLETLSFGPAGS
jgi:hypothetical protein